MSRLSQNWWVYLISDGKKTYVGITKDPRRRIREHNGEGSIAGAKSTKGTAGKWFFVCLLTGFSGRGEASRWENIIKKRTSGIDDRLHAMKLVAMGECPGRGQNYTPPRRLKFITPSDFLWENL
jgi:predicted GIY-YIG superfamily endonuclease